MDRQEMEYTIIRGSVSILATLCAASETKIIDLLTGYLWDEEEAGGIKEPLNQEVAAKENFMKNKLWCDLKTDQERIKFLRSGRAWETGIIARSITEDVAQAFSRPKGIRNRDNAPASFGLLSLRRV